MAFLAQTPVERDLPSTDVLGRPSQDPSQDIPQDNPCPREDRDSPREDLGLQDSPSADLGQTTR
eukprot:4223235-Prorocentrum_lima.AAC.1